MCHNWLKYYLPVWKSGIQIRHSLRVKIVTLPDDDDLDEDDLDLLKKPPDLPLDDLPKPPNPPLRPPPPLLPSQNENNNETPTHNKIIFIFF